MSAEESDNIVALGQSRQTALARRRSLLSVAHNEAPARANPIDAMLAANRFDELQCRFDPVEKALWAYQLHRDRPCFTHGLLGDVRRLQALLGQVCSAKVDAVNAPMRYLVWASAAEGVFNLGGDLELFAQLILKQDRAGLERYAKACIDICYPNAVNLDLPIVTVALMQGDALGGGFESALSSDVLVAERRARFGLPEILFGLFPGMGAYSFLARRIGAKGAERFILDGRIYSAQELHEMGIVDVLADDGFGEDAVQQFIETSAAKHSAHQAIYKVRRRFHPVTYDELMDVAHIWVDAALTLREPDVKKMRRLASAQMRRRAATAASAKPAPGEAGAGD